MLKNLFVFFDVQDFSQLLARVIILITVGFFAGLLIKKFGKVVTRSLSRMGRSTAVTTRSTKHRIFRKVLRTTDSIRKNTKPVHKVTIVIYLTVLTVAYLVTVPAGIAWWLAALTLITCHLFSSIKVVGPDENAVVVFLGKIVDLGSNGLRHAESGPHFFPWPMKVLHFTKREINVHFGTIDDPAIAKKALESSRSPSWFVETEPIRMNFGIPSAEEKKEFPSDPFTERLTTDPHMYVTLQIHDPATYYEVVGKSVREGIERVIGTAIQAMQGMAGKTFVAKAVTEMERMTERVKEELERLVGDPNSPATTTKRKSWGVDVHEFGIKGLGTSKKVNEALRDRAALVTQSDGQAIATVRTAQAARIKTQEDAAAEEFRLEHVGTGQAKANRLLNDAEADRIRVQGEAELAILRTRAEIAGTPGGAVIVQSEAIKAGLEHGKVVIMPSDGIGHVFSAITGGKEVLEATKRLVTLN